MRIPVIILSGFLGSGKTTLLLTLLEETKNRSLRPGILMNELGKQDVDGLILKEQASVTVQQLLDGCVCCSKKEELAGSLSLLLAQQPDVIFIELTGVANPEEISKALTEPEFIHRVHSKQIITLLDAENVLDYNSIFASDKQLVRTLRKQIEVADLIIVNKTDLVKPEQLRKMDKVIRKHNSSAAVIHTTHSQIDVPLLLKSITSHESHPIAIRRLNTSKSVNITTTARTNHDSESYQPEQNSYSQVKTLTLSNSNITPLSKESLDKFLTSWKDQLLRAKGYVAIVHDHSYRIYLVQYAGTRITWEPSQYPGSPYLVFIGMNLDEERLIQAWDRLLRSTSPSYSKR
ncbi:G3E family GTPase [Paenibacillus sp. DS2015]|uniref:CobW family GTP-binding protein n=1 Tax=Paenibacillus sp. DS2015 TaxID=3373917 RepID=UPI003D23CF5D